MVGNYDWESACMQSCPCSSAESMPCAQHVPACDRSAQLSVPSMAERFRYHSGLHGMNPMQERRTALHLLHLAQALKAR